MQKIYRGNKIISEEIRIPLKEGLYRGFKHKNHILKTNPINDKIRFTNFEIMERAMRFELTTLTLAT